MRLRWPSETPKTLFAGIGTLLALFGLSGIISRWLGAIAIPPPLFLASQTSDQIFFLLYGGFAIVLSHHLTHHPRTLLVVLANMLLILAALWGLREGGLSAGALALGGVLGLCWLHWFHAPKSHHTPLKLKRTS